MPILVTHGKFDPVIVSNTPPPVPPRVGLIDDTVVVKLAK